jgi:riboflavin biosynthesis pyrimidine reductase
VCTLARTLYDSGGAARAAALRAAGVHVLCVDEDHRGHPCLLSSLRQLRLQLGVRSVMIEGGAALIASCLQKELAHRLIVTIAPKTLINGLRPAAAGPWPSASSSPATEGAVVDVDLRRVHTFCLGNDVVLCAHGPAAHEEHQAVMAAAAEEEVEPALTATALYRLPMARL